VKPNKQGVRVRLGTHVRTDRIREYLSPDGTLLFSETFNSRGHLVLEHPEPRLALVADRRARADRRLRPMGPLSTRNYVRLYMLGLEDTQSLEQTVTTTALVDLWCLFELARGRRLEFTVHGSPVSVRAHP
jgi:hypothetical protein